MVNNEFGTLAEQSALSVYVLLHFAAGIVAYGFTRLILDGQKNISKEKQNLLVWTCFTGFFLLHTLWEFLETTGAFHKAWNNIVQPLFRAFPKFAEFFGEDLKYKGDSFANCFFDTIAFIGGFWMGYALIGLPGLEAKINNQTSNFNVDK
jgi:hypothetical protein